MSLVSINKISILGFGRMGKAMVSGWLENDLPNTSINIIDPNIDNNDKFIQKSKLQIIKIDEDR